MSDNPPTDFAAALVEAFEKLDAQVGTPEERADPAWCLGVLERWAWFGWQQIRKTGPDL